MTKTLQHLLPYSARLIGVQPECKSNDQFKIIVCRPTCRSGNIASLGGCRAKRPTLAYRFYGGSECRGYYPEQLHQFHFRHPNITVWDIHSSVLADCNNCSFHTPIILQIFHKLYSQTLIYRVQVWCLLPLCKSALW